MAMAEVPGPAGPLTMYVAEPADRGPWPGVVVVHDLAGMCDELRRQADWLAGEGFLVAAPDLFDRGTLLRCLRSTFSTTGVVAGGCSTRSRRPAAG